MLLDGIYEPKTADKLLTNAIVKKHIAWNGMVSESFKIFYNYLGYIPRSANHYSQNIAAEIALDRLVEIQGFYMNKPFVLHFDEASDKGLRKVLVIQISLISEERYYKPITIKAIRMDIVNATTVKFEINELCNFKFQKPDSKRC